MRTLNFINETCLKVFCSRAVICIKTIQKSVGMETHLIQEQAELKQLATFSLFVCHVILRVQNFYQGGLRPTIKPILYLLFQSLKI